MLQCMTCVSVDFQNGDFKPIGVLVGMSFIHGGSGYPFFAPSLYKYVCGQNVCTISPLIEEVPEQELRTTLSEVCVYTLIRSVCGTCTYCWSHDF